MTPASIAQILGGFVLLVAGAELLVRGASRLATSLGISPLIIGLTVVAFGTGMPEVAVGVQSAASGRTELALGNVVGSNLFNTLAILGVSALFAELVVRQKLVRNELPLVVGASVLVYAFASWAGAITRWQGAVLVGLAIAYTVWAIRRERAEPPEVEAEYVAEIDKLTAGGQPRRAIDLVLVAVGIGLLVLGGQWLVDGASAGAVALGMSELLVGVTIVAVGTSLPEAATSIVAAVRGQRDIAVGNVVGSNLFNLLVVLGLSAVVAPDGVAVPADALAFQLPVLIAVSVLSLGVFYARWAVRRWEGIGFLALYGLYLTDAVLGATGSTAQGTFRVVGAGIAAIFGLAVAVSSWRHYRDGAPPPLSDRS